MKFFSHKGHRRRNCRSGDVVKRGKDRPMETILKDITKRYESRYIDALEWKAEKGGKIIGCLPMYFPEEFVHAAGMLPVALFGDDEPITLANRHLMTNACEAVRGTYENLLSGRYDFLDGIGALLVCDQVRFFFEVWRLDHELPFFHQMWRPYSMDAGSLPFLVTELRRLRTALEEFSESSISDDALWESFSLYNETRRRMRELYALRRKDPGLIAASDLVKVVTAGMVMPKEDYNPILAKLNEAAKSKRPGTDGKPKLIVAGHPCAVPDLQLLDLIEEHGAVIADDDFFSGARYFEPDIPAGDDPLEAYATYCLNRVPCTTHHHPKNWLGEAATCSTYGDWLAELVAKNEARGVVLVQEMYCDPFDLEVVMLKKRFEEKQIPYLSLATEHGVDSVEPLRTRVQGFIEMITP